MPVCVRPVIGAAMRRIALLTVLLASLAVAAPATAKEVQSITVCGVDGCATSHDAELMSGMIDTVCWPGRDALRG